MATRWIGSHIKANPYHKNNIRSGSSKANTSIHRDTDIQPRSQFRTYAEDERAKPTGASIISYNLRQPALVFCSF
jgi:hypothetical protein